MKWNKTAIIAVIVIFSASYVYSSIKRMQLSNEVKQEQLAECEEKGNRACQLISKYHDDCFISSYRAKLKIREFHHNEYADCLSEKIKQSIVNTEN